MPDVVLQNESSSQDATVPADASASSAVTKQDVQEIVNSAVSSIAGVDGKSLSDVCTSLAAYNTSQTSSTVAQQLDYINSSVLLNAVLVGAVLGAVVMRYFLDHFGRRAK